MNLSKFAVFAPKPKIRTHSFAQAKWAALIQRNGCAHWRRVAFDPIPIAADMHCMSLTERHCAACSPSPRGGLSICGGAKGRPTAFRLSQAGTKRIMAMHAISAKNYRVGRHHLECPCLATVRAHGLRRANAGQLGDMKSKVNVVIARGSTQIKTRTGPWNRRTHRQRHVSMASTTNPKREVLEQAKRPSRYSPEVGPAVTKPCNEFTHQCLHHAQPPSFRLITCPHRSPGRGLQPPASWRPRSTHAQTLPESNSRSCPPSTAS